MDYLLSTEHDEGQDKARFFMRFGFSGERWEELAGALRIHGASYEVSNRVDTVHGTKYVVDGILASLDGRDPLVRTVWMIDTGSDFPRLVSAYPA